MQVNPARNLAENVSGKPKRIIFLIKRFFFNLKISIMKKYFLIFLFVPTLVIAQVDNWGKSIGQNKVKKVSIFRCQYKFGEPEDVGELLSDTIYDQNGNPKMINSSERYSKMSYYYDENNNVSKVTKYFTDKETEKPIFVFKNSYDDKNRLVESIEYGGSGKFMQKRTYQYDEKYNLTKKIISKDYDEITSSFKYDNNNRLTELSEFSSAKKSTDKTVYKYSKDGYLIEKIVNPDALYWNHSEYSYDLSGHLIEEMTYTISNQTIKVDYTSGKKILIEKFKYEYDDKGLLTGKIIFNKSTNEPEQKIKYKYE